MRRIFIIFVLSITAVGAYACGGSEPQPTTASSGDDVCPLVDAGPPPVCPEGCAWNGKECRKQGGIIIFDRKLRGDAGPDARPPVK